MSSSETLAIVTILAMAVVTYATRAGGFWLSTRFALSQRLERTLQAIPGAVLVSLVAPQIATGGVAAAVASVGTIAVAARTRNLLAAVATGAVLVSVLRLFT